MPITTSTDTASTLRLEDFILYNHQGVMAINKPAGVFARGIPNLVAPATSVSDLIEQARDEEYPDPHHVVHRLDAYTTGVMLIARDKQTARELCRQFADREIKKTYWALIDGRPEEARGIIDDPIPFLKRPGDPVQHKPAVTEYHTMQTSGSGISFLCFKPHTGRTHQLRIHAASCLNAPIIGDTQYHPDFAEYDKARGLVSAYTHAVLPPEILEQLNGQMLHARSISFTHPFTNKRITVEAPLPVERQNLWREFGFEPLTREM